MIQVKLLQLPHGNGLSLPEYATPHSAGADLMAAIEADLVIAPMQRLLVPTGIMIALPEGYEAQIRPRSGLALKHGITLVNTPGTIDADYRGEIKVLLINFGQETFTVTRGMRIAQMVIAPVSRVEFAPVVALDDTARGEGGFGSTGMQLFPPPEGGRVRVGDLPQEKAFLRGTPTPALPPTGGGGEMA